MNDRTVEYNGKQMDLYQATQQQRYIERQIRRWKREDNAFGVAASVEDDPALKNFLTQESWFAHDKVKYWQERQRDFIAQTGLRRDYFRERAGNQI